MRRKTYPVECGAGPSIPLHPDAGPIRAVEEVVAAGGDLGRRDHAIDDFGADDELQPLGRRVDVVGLRDDVIGREHLPVRSARLGMRLVEILGSPIRRGGHVGDVEQVALHRVRQHRRLVEPSQVHAVAALAAGEDGVEQRQACAGEQQ